MADLRFRGKVAIVGIGQTPCYRRGSSPHAERALLLRAIVAACEDANLNPIDVDGFSSYGADTNDGTRLNYGLGTRQMRWSTLIWGGGGGGLAGALAAASAAIIAEQAETVVVYRASAENAGFRVRDAAGAGQFGPAYAVYGIGSPLQRLGFQQNRLVEHDGIPAQAIKAITQASYFHARRNPRAIGKDIELTDELYDGCGLIVEPLRLFDCSRENDAAAAVILTSAERARELATQPAYILGCTMGASAGWGELDENQQSLSSAGLGQVGARLWDQTGYGPSDIDITQIYCTTSGAGAAALLDMGLVRRDTAAEVLTLENLIAPSGKLPINTAGGDLAEGFFDGMGNLLEAVRQIRGTSCNQIKNAKLSLVTGGAASNLNSAALLGSADTL